MKPRLVVLFTALALVAASPSPEAKSGLRARVTPRFGSATTRFEIRFRLPKATGTHGTVVRRYRLVVKAPGNAGGCVAQLTRRVRGGKAGTKVRLTLGPGSHGKRWCLGNYHGEIDEVDSPVCPKGKVCAGLVKLRRVGVFVLRVRAGGDTTPPKFAGLDGATRCTPGPIHPGETTPINLTWKAATDDKTPSSRIVYDIYMATTSGGERFTQPAWTTAPGATSFRTPGLASNATFYFVVRARDLAGNEDGNKVERHSMDLCV